MKWPRVPPWLALLLVAPAIGEVLSGSSPPRELLNPVGWAFLLGLYGGGALLVRETAFRWHKGWPSILALGAAYGIVEEGLMTKSFFDPGWMDVGILGSYGRWLGVNWVWTLELIVFHAVFSISIAILLVNLVYPGERERPWLGRRGLLAAAAALIASVVTGYVLLTPFRPGPILYGAAVLATAGLVGLAGRLPVAIPIGRPPVVPRPRHLFIGGFGWTLSLFVLVWIIPHTGLPAWMVCGLLVCLALAGLRALARLYASGARFTDRHKLALAGGMLTFFLLLDQLLFVAGSMPDMGLAGGAAAVLLYMLWRRVECRSKPLNAPP